MTESSFRFTEIKRSRRQPESDRSRDRDTTRRAFARRWRACCRATLTGIAVYAFFRFGAYVTQTIAPLLPLNDPAPALFLETLLNWGSAIGAGATFVIISLYQIIVLIKRLWERFRQ